VNYWIFKSEPGEYGIDHLAAERDQTARWDGIRNYQARNYLRDRVRLGDRVFLYHSRCRNIGIAGTMEVVRAAYPDPTQFEPDSGYYDEKSTPENPRWFCVNVRLVERFDHVIPGSLLKADPRTSDLSIFSQGRLSIAPVTATQWQSIQALKAR
jgi:predicted RNA-binding protein with PUA-like domain